MAGSVRGPHRVQHAQSKAHWSWQPKRPQRKAVIETEPIFASLSNVLRDYTNISPTHQLKGFELEPLEVII